MNDILSGLNEAQKQAVAKTSGPLLVVAGPGTGKTLTIVRRIAGIVRQGVRPESILAVTFTNRAAREMKERTRALLGSEAERIFIGTFHLFGLRMIRESRGADFVLYNREEQVELLKSLTKGSAKKARQAAEEISRRKNFLAGPGEGSGELYTSYQESLRMKNALDFDDLILGPIQQLADTGVLQKYRSRFRHIIVDEYQDINPAQYRLLRLLTEGADSICAVGDPDQAIYAFRGADVENFLNFEKDFPATVRVTLAENYRSKAMILNAAGTLIRQNRRRLEKDLAPTKEPGRPIQLISAPGERSEGSFIIAEIESRMGGTSHYQQYRGGARRSGEGPVRFSDFAVVFRTNAQARALEEAFAASGIPCQVIGRRSGSQAKEAAETLAYLRSLAGAGEEAGPEANSIEEKLLSDADYYDPRADAVSLLTLHAAKGLEFPVVFIAGCEEGLVPFAMRQEEIDVEEERRLFYVGMTRAKDELYLLHARSRFLYGEQQSPSPSPFLVELPEELMQTVVIPDKPKKSRLEEEQLGLF